MKGRIYLITNNINKKQYVGQTIRPLKMRLYEHQHDKRKNSSIHQAIVKYGIDNFTIQLLEDNIEILELNDREQYWIKQYNTYKSGYNQNQGGERSTGKYNNIRIKENNIVIDSYEHLGRLFEECGIWSSHYAIDKIKTEIANSGKFYNYSFETIKANIDEQTEDIEIKKWIQSLNIKFICNGLYCNELDISTKSIGEMATYLFENNYYSGKSQNPKQTITVLIGQYLSNGKTSEVLNNFTFKKINCYSKNIYQANTKRFKKQKIYCNELSQSFDSIKEAAKYLINNEWQGITEKTANCRISDILNNRLLKYKGLSFKKI